MAVGGALAWGKRVGELTILTPRSGAEVGTLEGTGTGKSVSLAGSRGTVCTGTRVPDGVRPRFMDARNGICERVP